MSITGAPLSACTRRTAPVRTMSSITRRALSTGMAKPMPSEPPVSE
ncbi:Uncharacterised protein [Bordetella pertussis]|nr:Uncharacterised protein [Bordetella pertussis]